MTRNVLLGLLLIGAMAVAACNGSDDSQTLAEVELTATPSTVATSTPTEPTPTSPPTEPTPTSTPIKSTEIPATAVPSTVTVIIAPVVPHGDQVIYLAVEAISFAEEYADEVDKAEFIDWDSLDNGDSELLDDHDKLVVQAFARCEWRKTNVPSQQPGNELTAICESHNGFGDTFNSDVIFEWSIRDHDDVSKLVRRLVYHQSKPENLVFTIAAVGLTVATHGATTPVLLKAVGIQAGTKIARQAVTDLHTAQKISSDTAATFNILLFAAQATTAAGVVSSLDPVSLHNDLVVEFGKLGLDVIDLTRESDTYRYSLEDGDGNRGVYVLSVPSGCTYPDIEGPRNTKSPNDSDRIVYVSGIDWGSAQIHVANGDGSDDMNLTPDASSSRNPAWSPDGKKIVFRSERCGGGIWVANADGSKQTPLTTGQHQDELPAWSPDGEKIAFIAWRGASAWQIYVMDANGTDLMQLTSRPGVVHQMKWSPVSNKIAYWVDEEVSKPGNGGIWTMNDDGSEKTHLTIDVPSSIFGTFLLTWSPDGRMIGYLQGGGLSPINIWSMNEDGSDQKLLTDASVDARTMAWSPDGSKIAFGRYDHGGLDDGIWVMNADGSDQTQLTTYFSGENMAPIWSHDGKKIAYLCPGDLAQSLCEINIDGSDKTTITENIWSAGRKSVDWSPVP